MGKSGCSLAGHYPDAMRGTHPQGGLAPQPSSIQLPRSIMTASAVPPLGPRHQVRARAVPVTTPLPSPAQERGLAEATAPPSKR
jgi:hypothetical protein